MTKVERRRKSREAKKLKAKLRRADKPSSASNGGAASNAGKTSPVYNAEGRVVFSKFDFKERDDAGAVAAIDAKAGKKNKKEDARATLKKITDHKEKIKSLEKRK